MNAGTPIAYIFVVTGPISPGTVTASDVPTALFEFEGNHYFRFNATGSVKFVPLSCRTPDVTVDMGTVRATDLKSVGASSTPVGFNVTADQCPTGLSSITYQFKAPDGVLDAAAGVIALSGDSTARGIALRLMNEAGAALNFDTPYTIPVKTGTSSYQLPLKAAYYRTSQTIGSGTANAIMTFTMSYN